MKTIKSKFGKFFVSMTALIGLTVLASCGNEIEEWIEDRPETEAEAEEHVMAMRLVGGRTLYADKRTTPSTEWEDGDIIYMRFYQADGETVVCGKATYKAADSNWTISYYGNLATGNPYKCEAFYFTDATAVDNYNVTMQPTSCAYVDKDATYMVDGGELIVSAELAPLTARLRIQGEAGKTVWVSGFSFHSSFELTEARLMAAASQVKLTFGEDGYTPYIYGSPVRITAGGMLLPQFTITLTDAYYRYTKTFDSTLFAAGESGYILMPTQEVNKGWEPTYYYPGDAVDMGLSVRWASTNLFANSEVDAGVFCAWGDPDGTYTGTSSSYNNTISDIAGNPAYDIATNLLGERWAIPTAEQWQELIDNCTWTYEKWDGEYQWTVTAENGNSIHLPMYGRVSGTNTEPATTSTSGYYWAATQYSSNYGTVLKLTTSSRSWNTSSYKYYRMQIRPVLVK